MHQVLDITVRYGLTVLLVEVVREWRNDCSLAHGRVSLSRMQNCYQGRRRLDCYQGRASMRKRGSETAASYEGGGGSETAACYI